MHDTHGDKKSQNYRGFAYCVSCKGAILPFLSPPVPSLHIPKYHLVLKCSYPADSTMEEAGNTVVGILLTPINKQYVSFFFNFRYFFLYALVLTS
jgi:hypothetical protein